MHLVENTVSAVFRIPSIAITTQKRHSGNLTFARQVAMYLVHVIGGLSLSEVGQLFARDRTTVAHACALVEDLRDDPMLDRCLAILELALSAAPQKGGVQ